MPCALMLHHHPCPARQGAPKRQRLNPAWPHGTAAAPALPEQLTTTDHDTLSMLRLLLPAENQRTELRLATRRDIPAEASLARPIGSVRVALHHE